MKKLILFMLLVLFGCSASNHFEINTTITPSIFLDEETHTVAFEYQLGDLLVLDQLKYMDISKYAYISRHPDNLKINLNVEYKSNSGCCMYFRYNLGAVELGSNANVVKASILVEHSEKIPGFVWYIRNDKPVKQKSSVDKKPVQEQTKKENL